MEWNTQSVTKLLLVGSSLTLSGCITPGLPHLDPPGFSSTYHQLDLSHRGAWQPVSGENTDAFIAPAIYFPNTNTPVPEIEVEVPDVTSASKTSLVRPYRSVLLAPSKLPGQKVMH